MKLKVYCDGAFGPRFSTCGWAAWAWVAKDGERVVAKDGGWLPRGTGSNNYAEYMAVGKALRWMRDRGHEGEVFTDSALTVNHVAGRWACNAEHLRPLRDRIRELMSEMVNVRLLWISREYNMEADALAKSMYMQARRAA